MLGVFLVTDVLLVLFVFTKYFETRKLEERIRHLSALQEAGRNSELAEDTDTGVSPSAQARMMQLENSIRTARIMVLAQMRTLLEKRLIDTPVADALTASPNTPAQHEALYFRVAAIVSEYQRLIAEKGLGSDRLMKGQLGFDDILAAGHISNEDAFQKALSLYLAIPALLDMMTQSEPSSILSIKSGPISYDFHEQSRKGKETGIDTKRFSRSRIDAVNDSNLAGFKIQPMPFVPLEIQSTGNTEHLRQFLNALGDMDMPLCLHKIQVEGDSVPTRTRKAGSGPRVDPFARLSPSLDLSLPITSSPLPAENKAAGPDQQVRRKSTDEFTGKNHTIIPVVTRRDPVFTFSFRVPVYSPPSEEEVNSLHIADVSEEHDTNQGGEQLSSGFHKQNVNNELQATMPAPKHWVRPVQLEESEPWQFDLFTPPDLGFDLNRMALVDMTTEAQLRSSPEYPEVIWTGLRQSPYRLKLQGFAGDHDDFSVVMIHDQKAGKWFVGRKGDVYPEAGFRILSVGLRSSTSPLPQGAPSVVKNTKGVQNAEAVLFDDELNRKVVLRTGEQPVHEVSFQAELLIRWHKQVAADKGKTVATALNYSEAMCTLGIGDSCTAGEWEITLKALAKDASTAVVQIAKYNKHQGERGMEQEQGEKACCVVTLTLESAHDTTPTGNQP